MLSSFLMALSYQDVFNAIMCLDSSMTVEVKKKTTEWEGYKVLIPN